jgi:hypothetical protein
VLAEVGKRSSSLELVRVAHYGAVVGLPRHRGMAFGCRRRAIAPTIGSHVVQLRGMRPALVRPLPMLYHCCFPAKAARGRRG